MSESWSDNPNAPEVDLIDSIIIKYSFRGTLIGAILHGTSRKPDRFLPALTSFVRSIVPGIVIVFFCQCMGVLLSPTNRKHKAGGIRWGFVALTMAMFLFSSMALALNLNALSFKYIDYARDGPMVVLPGSLASGIIPDTIGTITYN